MKYIFLFPTLVLLNFCSLAYGQSKVIKYLYDSSDIVIAGQVKRNIGNPLGALDWGSSQYLIQIKIDSLYKGNPKLSTFKTAEYVLYDDHAAMETIDSSMDICVLFKSRFYLVDTVLVKYPEHTFVQGEKVIVFLKELIDAPLGNRFKLPEDWYVYSLTDEYYGILPSNDFILEQFREFAKAKKE